MSDIIPDDSIMQPGYLPRTPFDAPHNPHVSVLRFREDFPEFGDDKVYTNQSVQFFLDIAGVAVRPNYWGQFTVYGMELYAAHMLALRQYSIQRVMDANRGAGGSGQVAVPGMPMGLMQSKSVSKVSVSYDYSSSQMEGWGPWNLTQYGQWYAFYAQMVGTGGIEMLSLGYVSGLVGQVQSWSHGVMNGYYYGGI
jgi:hypothetical protein